MRGGVGCKALFGWARGNASKNADKTPQSYEKRTQGRLLRRQADAESAGRRRFTRKIPPSRAFAVILRLFRVPGPDSAIGEYELVLERRSAFAAALAAGLFGFAASAFADCGEDMQKLAAARNNAMQSVNNFAKAAKGKPLDPAGFCSVSSGLLKAENALISYMEKNKDWCSFPDEAIKNLKDGHAKNAGFNARACQVAAKIKKMKEQAAQGGGGGPQAQPLPTGPL